MYIVILGDHIWENSKYFHLTTLKGPHSVLLMEESHTAPGDMKIKQPVDHGINCQVQQLIARFFVALRVFSPQDRW